MKFLLVVIVIAVAVYLAVRLIQDGGFQPPGGRTRQPRPRPKPSPQRPVAPDDDEEFLRDLDRKRLDPPDG
ncbi:hypothetical protein E8D34_01880 [Nocardioides sp. GY 10113]|uniref:hypothetical protein n=1 Tax=Nocardioides sp. GY 10113 TaxID=2569761 RepID=UPI0010A7D82C|nr:hypothetical protein [Nocardioides sp. GY 10113]TIC89262.1 hypothetical protein E8D34_01880 [Nocardioides sp. GY 10113]